MFSVSSLTDRSGPRPTRPPCSFAALSIVLAWTLAGCTDSIAPAPTGQIENNAVPGNFANDVPRSNAGAPVFGTADGSRTTTANDTPMTTGNGTAGEASGGDDTGTAASNLPETFYEVAAASGAGGPLAQAVLPDDRSPAAIETPAAEHPSLATFEPAAEESPALDPQTPYASIVDPAEGTLPTTRKPLELSAGGDVVEGVRFSSPAAGQVIVSTRVDGGTPRTRLERYDLSSGTAVSTVDLPDRAELIDVAPDGMRALVRLTFGLAPVSRPSSS